MPRTLQYIILFVVVLLAQGLLLDNLNLSIYIHPMIYLTFVVLLPMELAPVWVLLSAFALGALTDLVSGSAGLNSAAILFSAFARPLYLQLSLGKDEIREGGMPTSGRMGTAGFLRYCFALVAVHSLIYFSLEAATWGYFHLTLLRVALSTLVTVALIYFLQLFYVNR